MGKKKKKTKRGKKWRCVWRIMDAPEKSSVKKAAWLSPKPAAATANLSIYIWQKAVFGDASVSI